MKPLRTLRIAAGLSPTELAAKSGVSYPTILRLETGVGKKPDIDNAIAIARALGVRVEDIDWGAKPDASDDDTEGKGVRVAVA